MKTIFKTALMDEHTTVSMPQGSKILSVQVQKGVPVIWYECDTDITGSCIRQFTIVGTGKEVPGNHIGYIGTFQQSWFVGHVYEI